jgi:dual specificity phosphatase 12
MASATQNQPKCRVAVIGLNHQRVARVISLIHESKSSQDESSSTQFLSPIHHYDYLSISELPGDIPKLVEIQYLPCVATFDSYEDEGGNNVRYLVKLEYHGEDGMSTKGMSLAPFFDDDSCADDNHFPGIAAIAIGCGIDAPEDVEKITSFVKTLSSSCRQMTSDVNISTLLAECIQCNAEYSSMKEENDAFRNFSEDEKKEAIINQTIGPGKMAKFVYEVAQKAVCQRYSKQLDALEQIMKMSLISEETTNEATVTEVMPTNDANEKSSPSNVYIPDKDRKRFACKRCRTVLFGEADLEDPPHAQSLHNFRKKSPLKSLQSKVCANHFLSGPLPWMSAMDGMEGKLHCFKCETKIGHYSWTGAQCSCGTWVTPAIMIPLSKVDEMLPGGRLVADPNAVSSVIGMPFVYGAGAQHASTDNEMSIHS